MSPAIREAKSGDQNLVGEVNSEQLQLSHLHGAALRCERFFHLQA
jgi:hypothetical protein